MAQLMHSGVPGRRLNAPPKAGIRGRPMAFSNLKTPQMSGLAGAPPIIPSAVNAMAARGVATAVLPYAAKAATSLVGASTGGAVAAAIPYVGWAVAAATLLTSVLGNKGHSKERAAAAKDIIAQLGQVSSGEMVGRQLPEGKVTGTGRDAEGLLGLLQALFGANQWWGLKRSEIINRHPGTADVLCKLYIDWSKMAMGAARSAPVGATVNLALPTGDGGGTYAKNSTIAFNFRNPGVTSPDQFARDVLMPMVSATIQATPWPDTKSSASESASNPYVFKVFSLIADKQMADMGIPVPSELTAQQQASNAAANQAANQAAVVNQTVASGGVAPPVAPTPASPSSLVAPAPVQNTPVVSPSVITAPSGQSVDVQALTNALIAQGQSQQQAFQSALSALQSQGIQATPQVQQQVAEAIKNPQQAGFSWWQGALLLAVGIPLLMGMKGSKSSRRSRRTI